jgi:hypothetical protein
MRNTHFLMAILAGLAVAALTLSFPKIPKAPGVQSPIVELEFAVSASDVEQITSGYDPAITEAFRRNIAHDSRFILAYAGFLALSCVSAWRLRKDYLLIAGALLAAATGVFDHLENNALLNLLDVRSKQPLPHLEDLRLFTWLKWGGISAVFLTMAPFLWRSGRVGRGVTVFFVLTAFAGLSAWFNTATILPFTGLVSLSFLLLLIWEISYRPS